MQGLWDCGAGFGWRALWGWHGAGRLVRVWSVNVYLTDLFNMGPTCATTGPVHTFNNLKTKDWWFCSKVIIKSLASNSLPCAFYLWRDLHPCILGKEYFFFQYFLWAWIFKGKSGKGEAALSLSTTSTRTWTLQHLAGFMHLKWRTGRIAALVTVKVKSPLKRGSYWWLKGRREQHPTLVYVSHECVKLCKRLVNLRPDVM